MKKISKGQTGGFTIHEMLGLALSLMIGAFVLYVIAAQLGLLKGVGVCTFPPVQGTLGSLADVAGSTPCA